MIELVKQHHPHIGDTEVIKMLNRVKDDFCARTEIVRDSYTSDTVADQRYYALSDIDSSISEVTRVDYDGYQIPRLVGMPEKTDLT